MIERAVPPFSFESKTKRSLENPNTKQGDMTERRPRRRGAAVWCGREYAFFGKSLIANSAAGPALSGPDTPVTLAIEHPGRNVILRDIALAFSSSL